MKDVIQGEILQFTTLVCWLMRNLIKREILISHIYLWNSCDSVTNCWVSGRGYRVSHSILFTSPIYMIEWKETHPLLLFFCFNKRTLGLLSCIIFLISFQTLLFFKSHYFNKISYFKLYFGKINMRLFFS